MDDASILMRFGLAFAGSFLFGLTRQRAGKPIGFGTFIYVGLGSCALALTAIHLGPENPLPLLGSIVTGVGFLGAGALLKTGERVVGFTSAATIWAFAVFGLTLGAGEYLIGGLVYGAIWAVTGMDWVLERRWIGAHQRRLRVELPLDTTDEELAALLLPPRSRAEEVEIDREQARLVLEYAIDRKRAQSDGMLDTLIRSSDVMRVTIDS